MEGAVADKRLAERVALVTGGSRGIGAAIAARLAKDGAKVVVNYLQSEVSAARVVEEIEAAGGHAIALRGDVSQVDSASALVSETLKRFGAFDVLVNNAAINKAAPLDQVTEKSFDEHFAANVKSVLFMSQAAARVFKPGAVIINISSLNSRYPSGHLYSATKAALESLTISPSRKLGPRGIRVVAAGTWHGGYANAPGQQQTRGAKRHDRTQRPASDREGRRDRRGSRISRHA